MVVFNPLAGCSVRLKAGVSALLNQIAGSTSKLGLVFSTSEEFISDSLLKYSQGSEMPWAYVGFLMRFKAFHPTGAQKLRSTCD